MNWKKLLFATVACLAAIVGGGLIGGLLGRSAAEGQMLAGGAIVAFYMLIGALVGGAFAGFLTYRWPARKVGWMAVVMLVIAVTTSLILFSQVKAREALRGQKQSPTTSLPESLPSLPEDEPEDTVRWITQETSPPVLELNQDGGEAVQGFGFVHVPFTMQGINLLFYSEAALGVVPNDSLVYTRENHQNQLQYAPPYFQPFYLKEDYDSMILRLLGTAPHRVLVELNGNTGQRAWVDRRAIDISFWPEFLSQVFAVYPLDHEKNPVRIKPQDNASEVSSISRDDFLLPDKVVGDWIHVNAMTEGDSEHGFDGWLRWRRGDRLLIGWDYRL
ncbi:hypothetical protein [Neolewinella persica]|uniref:hypothetical protein n=1 Tax=Neolewinella persica TaxID=70998 RepID=UPI00036B1099|nr:hypothetical protein [Neolewinella persica]